MVCKCILSMSMVFVVDGCCWWCTCTCTRGESRAGFDWGGRAESLGHTRDRCGSVQHCCGDTVSSFVVSPSHPRHHAQQKQPCERHDTTHLNVAEVPIVMTRLLLLTLLSLLALTATVHAADPCTQYTSCASCISASNTNGTGRSRDEWVEGERACAQSLLQLLTPFVCVSFGPLVRFSAQSALFAATPPSVRVWPSPPAIPGGWSFPVCLRPVP